MSALESEIQGYNEKIKAAMDEPDFAVLLRNAIVTSSQTSSQEKHSLLAAIVANRMAMPSESLHALGSKIACKSIAYLTPVQLRLTAVLTNLYETSPVNAPLPPGEFQVWLERIFSPYFKLDYQDVDLMHLESLSCISMNHLSLADLGAILATKNGGGFDKELWVGSDAQLWASKCWREGRLGNARLTTVGTIIGINVSDIISGEKTEWMQGLGSK